MLEKALSPKPQFLNMCVESSVTVVPAAPVRLLSTLRLIASVKPESVSTNIIWVGPGGVSMKSETKPNAGTVAKVPQIQKNDSGAYVCMVRPRSAGRNVLFPFNVEVTVDGEQFESADGWIGHLLQKLQQQHYLFKHPVATILQSIFFKRAFFKSLR